MPKVKTGSKTKEFSYTKKGMDAATKAAMKPGAKMMMSKKSKKK